tara:strand:- start:786 stop:1532 length:747 start_codon:yes stop_codon:yes gene_type:complete
MGRIKLTIEYDGSEYVGWQRQQNGRSIQEEVEICLEKLFKAQIKIYVSGRTDAGVHAFEQIAHFDLKKSNIETKKISNALNYLLKKSKNKITILKSEEVSETFHSRFSVKKKIYLYKILNRSTSSFILENRVWHFPRLLNISKMKEASKVLTGKKNFNAFRSINCQAKTSIRSLEEIKIKKNKSNIEIRVFGKSFLHNQVRIIVGTLVNVGVGKWDCNKVLEILKSKDRTKAGPTAPSCGLYLEKVTY